MATHTANVCHLISHTVPNSNSDDASGEHSQTGVGGPAKRNAADCNSRAARCRIAFDREVGAVAVSNGNDSPVLLVGDISGRLWRSRPKKEASSSTGDIDTRKPGIAFAEGWLTVGSRDADSPITNVDDGPSFDMVQQKPGRGRRRCLPLGVDQMSICQTSNEHGGSSPLGQGILMVAAGSQSISPPSVIFVPNAKDDDTNEEIIAEDMRGLESTRGRIVSTLLVSSDAIGAASWRNLLRAMTDSKDTINGVDSATANSAVFLGMSDGSIYCSLVSASPAARQVGEEGSNRRLRAESLRVTPAKQIHHMTPNQGVASMFLIPIESLAKVNGTPPNLLVIVGCLGSVSILNCSSVSSLLQPDEPIFTSKSSALPRIGTCTSACPYQPCRMEKDMKTERVEFTIMTTFDDGSSCSCQLAVESFKRGARFPILQNRSPVTRLPIRRDAAVACSDLNAGIRGSEISKGVYIITFAGSLVGLQAKIQGRTSSSHVDQPREGSKASGGIMMALKRLCDATNVGTTTAKPAKAGVEMDGTLGAIQETRDAGRVVSQQNASKCQGKVGATNTDKWFHTCHVQQPMLSDLVGSQPSPIEDLPPLYYVDHDGDSIKVAYAGVTLNECTSLQDGKYSGDVHQSATQWNSRPMTCSSTLSCTFEHSTEKNSVSNMKISARIQDDGDALSLSNKKRKLQSLTDFPAGRAKSAYSDFNHEDEILGLVAASSNPKKAFLMRSIIFGDAISQMLEDRERDNLSMTKPRIVGSSLVEAEGAMIQDEILGRYGDDGKTKKHVTGQSILLSSCSAIAKKIAEKKTVDLEDGNANGGLESVSIEAVPSGASNDDSTWIRYGTTSSRLESDGFTHSSLPLLRSCIVDLLARRVSAPGEASIPLGEMEAVTLLDSYHKAIKNPRTKKMAMYLVMKADELLSKMKREQERSTEGCDDDEPVDVESVYLLYNQLRAIPLPLG